MANKQSFPRPWFIIVNGIAGGGRGMSAWQSMRTSFRQRFEVGEEAYTTGRGHATELARRAVAAGYRRLLAVGGDGTAHEVVNGLLTQREAPASEIRFALLPGGTGNDWIRTYRIPSRPAAWMNMIEADHSVLQDVGQLIYLTEGRTASRFFFNMAGIAFDAYVIRRAEESGLSSQFGYLWLLLKSLIRYRPVAARIRFEGRELTDRFYTIQVGIGRYAGGGMQVAPHALPADGQLALTLARPVSRLDILLNLWRFYNGSLGKHPKIELFQTSRLAIEALNDATLWVEADGEFLGESPIRIEIQKQALRVVVPSI